MAYGSNAPFGLRPFSSISGGSWSEKTNTYYIATDSTGVTTYATSIFTGDPVIWNPTLAIGGEDRGKGTIARYGFNTDGGNAANAVGIVGVFMGCEYTTPAGSLVQSPFWPASTLVLAGSKIKAFVLDDPDVVYDIQVSTWTNVLNDARFPLIAVGGNYGLGLGGGGANLVTPNPANGSTATGQSAAYLAKVFTANDRAHTLETLPLKVIGYTPNPTNLGKKIGYEADATTDAFLNVKVMINNHAFRPGTLGV